MSTATSTDDRPPSVGTGGRDAFWRVVQSEWTKLWSVRSTSWCLFALFVLTVGFSALTSWGTATHLNEIPPGTTLDPTNIALAGTLFGQLPAAVLGVLIISGEYSSGGIRASLTAVPHRQRFLFAKAVVFTAVVLVVGVISAFVSFFVGMIFFNASDVGVGIGEPSVLRAVIGGGLFLAAAGLVGFALGILLRHTAGAIAVAVALLFVVPIVLNAIPTDIVQTIGKYFFSTAGGNIMRVEPVTASNTLAPWWGYAVFCIEWAILLAGGSVLLDRRDA